MTNQQIQPYSNPDIAAALETFGTQLGSYLEYLGLPKDQILVPYERRGPVFQNMPIVLEHLTDAQKLASTYVSKFVAACAVGLFDAALNYLWNETVRNLRDKVTRFDLDYFFDSVASESVPRSKLKSESDLVKLDDWVLIGGCRTTGIITETGYRHLDYIRSMRNHASAAHPNQNDITGLQIVSWLETCIVEVLAKEPDGPVIEVRKLLRSLRTQRLTEAEMPVIQAALPSLNADLSESLFRSVFGMYTDVSVDAQVRDNLKLVARSIWEIVSIDVRREAGLKHAVLTVNGDVARAKLAREFIEIVDGLEFLNDETRVAEMSETLNNLISAHNGMNNFYAEPAPARLLHRLVPLNGDIPALVLKKYVKTVTMCRIGNGFGVSWGAIECYDEMIARFGDVHIREFINLIRDPEISYRLETRFCSSQFQKLAATLETRSVNPRLKEMLSFIGEYEVEKLSHMASDNQFERLRETLRI